MKLISLNIWAGTVFEPLMKFIRESARATDIFCFQEVLDSSLNTVFGHGAHSDIFKELQEILPDFKGYFDPAQDGFDNEELTDTDVADGLAVFIKENVPVTAHGSFFLYRQRNEMIRGDTKTLPEIFQYARITKNDKPLTIAHFHGISLPGDKLDTPDRLEQSSRIIKFLSRETGEKILCGDFNLMPETQSLDMIEQSGMRNLIKEFDIKTTRSRINYEKYSGLAAQHFADYTFVSRGINVMDFKAPNIDISDHLPMVLDFQL